MSDLDYQIVWLLRRLFRALADRSNQNLLNLGVTAADRAVMEFLYPDLTLSVPEIAARYQVSRQHVPTTVNRLQDAGLLQAAANPRHRRSPLILLTRRGRELFERIKTSDLSEIEALFGGVPEKDRQITVKTLDTIFRKLQENKQ